MGDRAEGERPGAKGFLTANPAAAAGLMKIHFFLQQAAKTAERAEELLTANAR